MTRDQVASEKSKVRLDTASAHDEAAGWNELPKDFLDLVTRSLRLQALVRRMDEEIYGGAFAEAPSAVRRANPVSDQITLLNTAFARG
jgi:regulator of CtrA degradation